jgi:CRISPR system Cascade subunit CasA
MTEPPAGSPCLDLLSESLLTVDGPSALNLSQVFAALSRGENLVFTHLRPHQQAPWHAFLVQLAYLALEKAALADPPQAEADWTRLLLALSDGQPSAWQLCADDWQRPAFLQPPCSPGRETDYKATADSAQALDLLVTSRNFDEKAEKVAGFAPRQIDAWVYALVALQGGAPFQGAGNYSSMRMNGGFSARPQFRLAFERGTGPEFLRDLRALIENFGSIWDKAGDIGSGRCLPLLWLEPWDDAALPLADVHPLALEVCRRVRLRREDGLLVLRRASSKSMRVAAKELLGAVHDPWIPLMLGGDAIKALTVQADGLSYRRLSTVLLDRSVCKLPLLAQPTAAERTAGRPATLVAQVLVGGQGRTDGLLRRELLMPMPVLRALTDGDARLAQRSNAFVQLASQASGKVLRPALMQFIDGSDDVDWQHPDPARMAAPWLARLEVEIDSHFFTTLFDGIACELSDEAAQDAWEGVLRQAVITTFNAACEALPTRNSSPLFAHARAERLLHSAWLKQFGRPLRGGAIAKDATEDNAKEAIA